MAHKKDIPGTFKKETAQYEASQVYHNFTVFFTEMTKEDTLLILEMFRAHGWKHFLNHQIEFYVND